jgi:hypothetical protein
MFLAGAVLVFGERVAGLDLEVGNRPPVQSSAVLLVSGAAGGSAPQTMPVVRSVEWAGYGPNDAPEAMPDGDRRIFPDRNTGAAPGEAAGAWRFAVVRATIESPLAGVTVFFSWWDVDDSSASGPPLDLTEDADGPTGCDNRDTSPYAALSARSAVTDERGVAEVICWLSPFPGDNQVVIASTSRTDLESLTQAQVDGRRAGSRRSKDERKDERPACSTQLPTSNERGQPMGAHPGGSRS